MPPRASIHLGSGARMTPEPFKAKEKILKRQEKQPTKLIVTFDLETEELTTTVLLSMVRIMYPGVEDPDLTLHEGRNPHPLNAAAVVLMSAALNRTTDTDELKYLTGYRRAFLAAVKVNMRRSGRWSDDRYDASAWLSSKGVIDPDRLHDEIEIAVGMCSMLEADGPIDACQVYWRGLRRAQVEKTT
jgi:hypothetical protein